MSKGKILFQLSGSIACFKACAAISRLVQDGFEIEVVATDNALKFVGEASLEGLTGRAVHTSTFAQGGAMEHIDLAKWADLAVVYPASAGTLAKLAGGLASDLLSTLFLAHDFQKPYWIAPAMNTRMYHHPATQASLAKLRDWGVRVLEPGHGALACGDVGDGRLMEPETLVGEIRAHFEKSRTAAAKTRGLRVLLTSGGTREPIDGVRVIANASTGTTGAQLADAFAARGFDVTIIQAETAVSPRSRGPGLRIEKFRSFEDLRETLHRELMEQEFDAIFHLAAVSDFSVGSVEVGGVRTAPKVNGKLESTNDLVLHLKRTPKLIDELRRLAPRSRLFGFKLTRTPSKAERDEAVATLLKHADVDYVVQNDLDDVSTGDAHVSCIYEVRDRRPHTLQITKTKTEMARVLGDLVAAQVPLSREKEVRA